MHTNASLSVTQWAIEEYFYVVVLLFGVLKDEIQTAET